MSIRDQQITLITDKALQEELKAGRYPELSVIRKKVSAAFINRSAGLPRFIHQPVQEDEVSNPTAYNQMVEEIHEDLAVSFGEVGYQTDRMLSVANVYETEKRNIQLSLRQMENRTASILEKLDNRMKRTVVFDTFHDFNQVDFKGDAVRGIPKTNAFVDLRYGQATIETVHTGGTRYDISGGAPSVKVTKGSGKGLEVLPFANALVDTVNEAWQYLVSSNLSETTEITATVELPALVQATVISIDLHSPRETEVLLRVSSDNETYTELKSYTSYGRVEWKLDQKVKFIQFVMRKHEPDYVFGTEYEYQFGATNIGVKYETYLTDAYLVSKSYEINGKVINKMMLKADSLLYPKTAIRYYVGIDHDTDIIEWQEIEENKPFYLNRVTHKELNVSAYTAGYDIPYGTEFGTTFYEIAELVNTPEPYSTKVLIGDYMWQQDTRFVTMPNGYMPTLQDWLQQKGITTMFVPIEKTINNQSQALAPGSLQRFTTHIFCENEANVFNNEITIGADTSVAVYVNSLQLKPVIDVNGKKKYNYAFKAGWNKIEILTYAPTNDSIKMNLYLKDIAPKIFANKEPLQEISLYDLMNNVSIRNLSHFSVVDNKIVVNYSPKALDESDAGIRYKVEYDFAPLTESRDTKLRFMAILSRAESTDRVTPILKSYQLVIE